MRVACISQFSDFVGGGEHSLFELLHELPERWHPLLVTPQAGPLSARASLSGIDVVHLPMPGLGPASLPALGRWSAWLRAERPLLLHANNSRAAVYAGITGRLHGIPMIFHCRIAERDARLDWLIGRLASRIICNSRAVAERFESRRDKVEVIYNGIAPLNVKKRAAKPWGAKSVLLFVGRMSEEKQPDVAVRAFAELAGDARGMHLVMAGGDDPLDPDYGPRIRAEAARLACADRIHWLGQCENMAPWYAIADLLVVPSRHEGFGRVIVEAMGCGVPVAAFAVGGIPEVLQDGVEGRLVRPGDKAALARAMHDMLADDLLHRSMSEAGLRRAPDFSPAAHAEAVARVYTSVVGAPP
jgi:glycosyltransferase involved in cell wall biosynthesis